MRAKLASEQDVDEGKAKELDFFGRPALILKKNGKVHAYINVCTHVGGPCKLEDGTLKCQWHGTAFDSESGKVIQGSGPAPPDSRLIKLPIIVESGTIFYVYGE
jgi:nitrite reductase/ring-hydroxylating ferredoxin subunit